MTFDYDSLIIDPDPFPNFRVLTFKPDEFRVGYGWLLPCCTLILLEAFKHNIALMKIGKEERQAELEGWIKIDKGPLIPGPNKFFNKFYTVAYVCTKMTNKQKHWLTKKGFILSNEDNGVQTYFLNHEKD
jgi:hypothetical protein